MPSKANADVVSPGVVRVEVQFRSEMNRRASVDTALPGLNSGDCIMGQSLVGGFRSLRADLELAATKKDSLNELIKRDKTNLTRKRSAVALVQERLQGLKDKHVEWSRAHDKACEKHQIAHSQMTEAQRNLSTGMSRKVGPDLMITLQQVQVLTTMLERGCENNVKRLAEKMEIFHGRVKDCEEEAITAAKELELLELQLSTGIPSREKELQSMNDVIEFLDTKAMASP